VALALYRKYRPRTFAEVIGQEHVTEPLSQALRSGRLNHAYLFSGPRGCGKTSSARILARSLNCEKGPTPEPCGECQSCRDLAPDGAGSIDVIEIDAASHGGVDDARDLRERAFFAPVASRFKVYVIDEAHMVSTQGFNALLKLVEEPPEFVKFVFATTEPEKVLGTIKSRTHHYPFRLIPPGVLRPYLEKLCDSEGVTVEQAVFPLVVRAGAGSVRDSLSVLDQLIAGAGTAGVSYARAVSLLGVTDAALIDEMCDALAAGDGGAAYLTVDRVAEAGHDPRRFAADLLERLRDLIVLQQVPDAAAKGLLDAPDDQLERMAAQATRIGPATLSRFADIVHNGLTEMRGTTAPRLLLELIAARMLLPGTDDSSSALLQRLERMERRLGAASEPSMSGGGAASGAGAARPAGAPVPPPPAPQLQAPPRVGEHMSAPVAPPAVDPPTGTGPGSGKQGQEPVVGAASVTVTATVASPPAGGAPDVVPVGPRTSAEHPPADSAPVVTVETVGWSGGGPGALDGAGVRRVWDEILMMVRRQSQRAWAVVREATVRDVDGDTLVLLFQHAVHADMLTKSPDLLTEAVTQVLGGTWQVRCELGGGAPRSSAAERMAGEPAQVAAPGAGAARPAPSPRAPRPGSRSRDSVEDGDDGWPATAQPGGDQPAAAGPEPGADHGGSSSLNRGRSPGPNHDGSPGADPSSTGPAGAPLDPAATSSDTAASVAARGAPPRATPPRAVPQPGSTGRSAAATAARAAAGASRQGASRQGASRQGGGSQGGRSADAASQGGTARPSARAQTAGAAQHASTARSAAGAVDEPPYDPDYDPPVRDPGYPGFDPGDEPGDEGDRHAVRESSEEQALRLLAEALGAEKIAERGP
jgi:DNA polymerase-3 subunit gamma/tau